MPRSRLRQRLDMLSDKIERFPTREPEGEAAGDAGGPHDKIATGRIGARPRPSVVLFLQGAGNGWMQPHGFAI